MSLNDVVCVMAERVNQGGRASGWKGRLDLVPGSHHRGSTARSHLKGQLGCGAET